ncbi:hypothetical protein KUF71_010943 [Frankliniella fusca]|uniref:ATP-dependent DNA helicase n=1 Tax=Frankliniella fusca TaxID=407009 RepID=A0AAE1HI29_9NEOP|nr:hypothetical protein KUF71_010943 [Frankliniella fusca]
MSENPESSNNWKRKPKDEESENTEESKATSSNARRCKMYRSNLTEDMKNAIKVNDRLRQKKRYHDKKTEVKCKKKLNRTVSSIQRRRNNQKMKRRQNRKSLTSDQIFQAREKDRLRKRLNAKLPDTSDEEADDEGKSSTDRTYLANKLKVYKGNLKKFNVLDSKGLFGKMINDIKWNECLKCKTKILSAARKCYCTRHSAILQSSLMSIGDVPSELSDLTAIEELLIAMVHPVVQVFRLRGGQFAYSGHVINFFQDVKGFAKILPHSIEDINGVVKVCCKTKAFHQDFSIRKDKVLQALLWLKTNNPYYSDIEIDNNIINNLPDQFDFEVTDNMEEDDNLNLPDEDMESEITSSSIPQTHMLSAEEKLKYKLKWPQIESNPISEMVNSHYIVKAFPTLFPYGIGDVSDVINERITARQYFQYLMDFLDGRFASHKIFPYFAWNSVMRWECLTKGTVYMKKHPEMKKMNIALLKELMLTNNKFGRDVMVYSSSIRSTRNFWFTRSAELQDMVNQIDLPTIFFTLTSADFHWPRLYDLLKEFERTEISNESERHKLMFNNPKICSDYFYQVAEKYINDIMIAQFKVKDHWYRYEWQLRGSPHVHGVLWLNDAVNVHELQTKFNEVKDKIIEYFDKLVSCQNPNTDYILTSEHPCRTRIEDILDPDDDFAALVNTVQRHTQCSIKTCLKKDKAGTMKCKYNFPKPLREKSEIVMSPRKYLEFEPARNDPLVNKFSGPVTVEWRSNHDFTMILSPGGFAHYIAKYATKPEVKSFLCHDLFLKVIEKCGNSTTLKSAVQRTLMSALVERDYSAQEVHHLLSGNKLYSCSRTFITLNLNINEWFFHMNLSTHGNEDIQDNCSQILDSYVNRADSLKKISLMDFLRHYNTQTYTRRKGRPTIVRVFPRLDLTIKADPESNPCVARQLCLLFHPWNQLADLPADDVSWMEMKEKYSFKYQSLPYYKAKEEKDSVPQYDSDDDEEKDICKSQDDWMKILCNENVEVNMESDLGSRDIDNSFNWKSNVISYEQQISYGSFVKDQKKNFIRSAPLLPPDLNFHPEQNEVLEFVDSLAESLKISNTFGDLPKFLVCQANAGCGKTVTIQGVVHLITQKCGEDSVAVIAPTAAAAVNAGGRTIHSALRIVVGNKKENIDLSGECLHKFQQELLNVRFVIIDEFSMVGCKMFSLINRRCMQIRDCSEFFGGCALLLFGDVKQLDPVGDSPLCKSDFRSLKPYALDGFNLFQCVEEVKVLKTCHRQSEEKFAELLSRVSHGIITQEDKQYLRGRFEQFMSNEEKLQFESAVHLFMKRKDVQNYNEEIIRKMNIPILKITAENNSAIAAACSDEVACNLSQNLYLGIGVRVMLKANLWTEAGLVNGALGVVDSIVYNQSNETMTPDFIMVKFDNYKGPIFNSKSIPIPRILRTWHVQEHYCSRLQFPIDLSYATTFHKCQGLTIPKCVIHINEKERCPGMYYVALSRVRQLSDLIIVGNYENCPLFKINSNLYSDRNASEQWLLSKASRG